MWKHFHILSSSAALRAGFRSSRAPLGADSILRRMMATRGVLILECLDGTDPGSEGLFLSHMFILMKVDYQYVEVRTKAQFLALLRTWPYELIHITIHGSVGNASGKFLGLWLRGDNVSVEDL